MGGAQDTARCVCLLGVVGGGGRAVKVGKDKPTQQRRVPKREANNLYAVSQLGSTMRMSSSSISNVISIRVL